MSAARDAKPPPQGVPRLVSLTTDFGLADPFVGLVKAQILRRCPGALIVDLTHEIAAHDVEAAAFWLERSWDYFPAGSLHLVVVDPGVGGSRGLLAVQVAEQLFLGPDNGALGGLAAMSGGCVRKVSTETLGCLGLTSPSATFHGRDVLAPLVGELAAGRLRFDALGPLADGWVRRPGPDPKASHDRVLGRVILVDRFGNCFSNIEAQSFISHEVQLVRFGGHCLPLVRSYAERPPGTDIALINAFGVLEAARVQGRAADALGLGPGSPVEVSWQGEAPAAPGA
jgi:S-adenosylmethionine hydrolase